VPTCPTCDEVFADGQRFCPADGAVLDRGEEVHTVRDSDDLVGRVLDKKYRLDEKVGVGGMGAVYRARHLLMDRRVALKIVRPEVLTEHNSVRRFHREAKHSCRLDHPNCVRVTDFGAADDGLLYLVMEFLDGKTVGEEIYYDGPLSAPRIARIGAQVARALHHAHGLGIIHRDLKPDNVMLLRKDGDPDAVKVLDFGLAKLLEREDGDLTVTNPSLGSLTEAGIVFGTPEYMSPEQASGNPLDPRTDLYSLGVVMYQMATGHLPFKGDTFMAILTQHVTTQPVPPARRRPDLGIPLELDRVIMHCLEKDPADRPADAKILSDTLQSLAGSLPTRSARVPELVSAAATIDLTAQLEQSGAATMKMPSGFAPTDPAGSVPRPMSVELTDPVAVAARPKRRRARTWWVGGLLAAVGAAALGYALTRGDHDAAEPEPSGPAVPAAAIDAGVVPLAPDARPAIAPAPADASTGGAPEPRPKSPRQPSKLDPALESHLAAAETARRAKRWLKVIAEADQALKIDPRSQRAAFLMGDAQLASGDKANGCKYLRMVGGRWGAKRKRETAGCDD